MTWYLVGDVVVLLGSALVCGILSERLKQNAVVGYLLTGVLLGPAGFNWLRNIGQIRDIAELGVALLLFTIGLEFSWSRLRELGAIATAGGALQILLTGLATALVGRVAGLDLIAATVIAAAVSLSSTAVVLRVLSARAELDSLHGRTALGILLLQDIAVVPLVLLVSALGEKAGGWKALTGFAANIGNGLLLVLALFLLTRHVLPRMLHAASSYRNRDLPAVLVIVYSFGCAGASHAIGLSPALGAFVAGMLLAESPFAQQIQADIVPLRAGFVTLFFASVGTMAVVPGIAGLFIMFGLAAAIVVGKALVVALVVLLFRRPLRIAVASGLALAQIGEFSFVLAGMGRRNGILPEDLFQLLLSASVLTLLLTPYLVEAAPRMGALAVKILMRFKPAAAAAPLEPAEVEHAQDRVIVVGFGPAGQGAVEVLRRSGVPFLVIDLNPRTADTHRTVLPIVYGDATTPEVLEHCRLALARALLVTIPDTHAAAVVVSQARRIAPDVPVVARARYHIHAPLLSEAGAGRLIDEEYLVGEHLGVEVTKQLAVSSPRQAASERTS